VQISTAIRVLAEIIASDVLLVTFNNTIDGVIQNNPKAGTNPKALVNWMATKDRWWVLCRLICSGSGSKEWPRSKVCRKS